MPPIELTEDRLTETLALAQATPQRLSSYSAGFDDAYLSQAPSVDTWSPLKILNHLRACEEVWMHSIYATLAHDVPRLKEIHPRHWIKTTNSYTALPFSIGLQVFTLRREAALITLRALPYVDWARECRIERKTHTVFTHVWRLVQHENVHCDEVEAILTQK